MLVPGEAIALFSAIIWAVGTLMYRAALRELSPTELTFVRSVSAALALTIPAILLRPSSLVGFGARVLVLMAISGVLLFLGDILYFRCVGTAGIWIGTPLSSTYPLYVAIIAYVWLGEGVTTIQVAGMACTVSGIASIAIRHRDDSGHGVGSVRSAANGLIAALAWAFSLVTLRAVLVTEELLPTFSVRMVFVVIFMGTILAGRGGPRALPLRSVSRSTAVLSLVSGAWGIGLGGFLFFYSMGIIGTARATAISATYPLFAGLMGTLVLGERMTINKVVGTVLVVSGLILLV